MSEPPPGVGSPDQSRAGGGRRSSTLVAAGIGLSRVSGLVRERAIGHFLGSTPAGEAFSAAIRIPSLLQDLLGEGVLSASFIPVYSRLLSEGKQEEAGRVAGAVAGILAAVTGVLVVAGIVLAAPLTTLVAAGLRDRPEVFALTVTMVRILFPAVGLLALSAWCLGVLNSHRRFFLSYVAPVVLNVVQIAVLVGVGAFLLGPALGRPDTRPEVLDDLVVALAWGTVAGGLLQAAVQLPAVRREATGLRFSLDTSLPGVRRVARSVGPVVMARGVVRISAFVQVFLASYAAAGALAVLRFGQLLYTLPVSLFGMAVAAAELPELSGDGAGSPARLQRGLARIATYVLPTSIGYVVVGDMLVGALFQTGSFGRVETLAVWAVTAAYALGLPASTGSRLLQSALYGVGDTRTPSRASVVRILLSVVVGGALMIQLDRVEVGVAGLRVVGDLPALWVLPEAVRTAADPAVLRLGPAGLGLGAGIAAWVEYVQLRRAVTARFGPVGLGGEELLPILLATMAGGAGGLLARQLPDGLPLLVRGVLALLAVAVPYALVGARLGVTEVRVVLRQLLRRLR